LNARFFGFLVVAKPAKWLESRNAGLDASKIQAQARNKPFRAGASHFFKPKT
jgi:hypothetical protein